MRELLTVVTQNGRITIPVEIRRALNLEAGDKVAFSLVEDETPHMRLRRVGSVVEMTFGSITPRKQAEDMMELRQMFMDDAALRDERTKQRP